MKRNTTLVLVMALCALVAGCQDDVESLEDSARSATTPDSGDAPLNVILITIDTLRADALGAYGQKRFTSPNVDQLSREGVLFSHAMTSAPSTLPSHSSIMTAKHPYAHGARSNAGYILADENETLAEVLQRNDYRTGAEIAATVLDHRTQLNQGFDQYRDTRSGDITRVTVSISKQGSPESRVALEERPASDITKFGIEFLNNNVRDPFFLWLHYFDPHAHYIAPPEFQNLIPDSPYHAEVRYVDSEIGRLIRHLKMLQLDDRTIVVITADHGESLDEHNENTHSAYVYQTTMHVPLIIWGPSTLLRKGWRVDSLVRTIDIAPTILDLINLPSLSNVQGRSLVPLMAGETADLELTGYGETTELHSMFGDSILRCVRRGNWKYIHKLRPQLFDLAHDPRELENVAAQYPERVEKLKQELRDEIANAPEAPHNAETEISDETIRQLQALGYAGAGGPSAQPSDELASLELKGPDPSDLTGDFHDFGEGWYYYSLAKYERSAELFGDLAARHPKSLKILTSFADSMIRLKRFQEAIDVLHRAIEIDPDYERAYDMLAECQLALGKLEESEATTRRALAIEPCASAARLRLASLLGHSGRSLEQRDLLEQGVESCPDAYEVSNNYAVLLSTSPNAEIRNGVEAVRIATLAVEKSGGTRPAILDTLAGAHAEVGDFETAVSISRRAITMAVSRKLPPQIIDALRDNLKRFEMREPLRKK